MPDFGDTLERATARRRACIPELSEALVAHSELGTVLRAHLLVEKELTAYLGHHIGKKIIDVLDPSYATMIRLSLGCGMKRALKPSLVKIGRMATECAENADFSLSEPVFRSFYNTFNREDKQAIRNEARINARRQDEANFTGYGPKEKFAWCAIHLWFDVGTQNDFNSFSDETTG